MNETIRYHYSMLNITQTVVDQEIEQTGHNLYYEGPADGPEISVRIGRLDADQILFRPQTGITTKEPFTRLWVSATVGAIIPRLFISSPADFLLRSNDVSISTITSLTTLGTITNPVPLGTLPQPWEIERARASALYQSGLQRPASVGNLGHHQIWNPAASGKTVVVLGYAVYSDQNSYWSVALYNAQLTNNHQAFPNANSGAAAASAQHRYQDNAVALETTLLDKFATLANSNMVLRPTFIVLGAGEGLNVICQSGNAINAAHFRIWEF